MGTISRFAFDLGLVTPIILFICPLHALFPDILPSFSGTSVLPFFLDGPAPFRVRLPYRFGCRSGSTLSLDSVFLRRDGSAHGDPAGFSNEKAHNGRPLQTALFSEGAPWQPSLQDYAAHAHPSLGPQSRTL